MGTFIEKAMHIKLLHFEIEFADQGKAHNGFARSNSTTLGATQATKCANSKTSHIPCLLGIDSCVTLICPSMGSTSHKAHEM